MCARVQGECKFHFSKIQINKDKKEPLQFTIVSITCLWLNLNFSLQKNNKTNISSGRHATSLAWSGVLKVVPRQPVSGEIKMSGIQVEPQDETDVLAVVLM